MSEACLLRRMAAELNGQDLAAFRPINRLMVKAVGGVPTDPAAFLAVPRKIAMAHAAARMEPRALVDPSYHRAVSPVHKRT